MQWCKNWAKSDDRKERRMFERYAVKAPLSFLKKGLEKRDRAQSLDISANGIRFISKVRLLRDTPLEIWLGRPNQVESIHITGKVIWSKDFGLEAPQWHTGVHFTKADLLALGQICRGASTLC